MDELILARWQFGITTIYHFFFVPMTIGLTWLVSYMQTKWLTTGDETWLKLTKLFGKLFLINFTAGVVTGIVQEFQFGMNWSEYSRFVGDIFGAPLALEALIAFFLESTFVGLWIFGWDKLPKKLHLATIYLTATGTTISAIFILAANSWMQNPVGSIFENGRAQLNDFVALVTNPFFLTTFPHTLAASFIVAGGLVLGVSGYWAAKTAAAGTLTAIAKTPVDGVDGIDPDELEDTAERVYNLDEAATVDSAPKANPWLASARFGAIVVVIACLAAILSGDFMGKVEAEYQPAKLAASEGIFESGPNAEFCIIGSYFSAEAEGECWIGIPGLLSWLAYGDTDTAVLGTETIREEYAAYGYRPWEGDHWGTPNALQAGQAPNLTNLNIDPIPNVALSFWSFRLMIGLGGVGLLAGLFALLKLRKGAPQFSKGWVALMVFIPLWPMLANIGGWLLAELGRQPWIVYGVLPTASAVSPSVSTFEVVFSMALYTLVYAVVAVIVVKLFLNQIHAGLPEVEEVSDDDADKPLQFAY
jgi:cytochrome d ubiquinol oxidase subunit I